MMGIYNIVLYGVPTLIIIRVIIYTWNNIKEYQKYNDIFRSKK